MSFQTEIRDAFYRHGGGGPVTQEQRLAYAKDVEEITARHGTSEMPDPKLEEHWQEFIAIKRRQPVYSRPECVFNYCPHPDQCQGNCQQPLK